MHEVRIEVDHSLIAAYLNLRDREVEIGEEQEGKYMRKSVTTHGAARHLQTFFYHAAYTNPGRQARLTNKIFEKQRSTIHTGYKLLTKSKLRA